MNEYSPPGFGKISMHGDGMGAPTPELIEKRARELAMIDERDPNSFTDADWDEARQELMGVVAAEAPEEITGPTAADDEHELVPGTRGHRAPRAGLDDDESLGEHLVADGLEEAAHDQMLEASKSEQTLEGGT